MRHPRRLAAPCPSARPACAPVWIEKYRCEVRPSLVVEPDDGTIFLTKDGTPLIADHLSNLVKRYVEAAHMGKTGACHLFRHTMAHQFLADNGNDLVGLAQLLGHESLNTTSRYCKQTQEQLAQASERLTY